MKQPTKSTFKLHGPTAPVEPPLPPVQPPPPPPVEPPPPPAAEPPKLEPQRSDGGAKRARTGVAIVDRVGANRRIRWDGSTMEPLDGCGAALARGDSQDAAWIQVQNVTHRSPGFAAAHVASFDPEPYYKELAKVEAIIAAGGRVPAVTKKACVDATCRVAQAQHYTSGKWLLYF